MKSLKEANKYIAEKIGENHMTILRDSGSFFFMCDKNFPKPIYKTKVRSISKEDLDRAIVEYKGE